MSAPDFAAILADKIRSFGVNGVAHPEASSIALLATHLPMMCRESIHACDCIACYRAHDLPCDHCPTIADVLAAGVHAMTEQGA